MAEVLGEYQPVPLKRVGVKDTFGISGKPEVLLEHFGLMPQDIIKAAQQAIQAQIILKPRVRTERWKIANRTLEYLPPADLPADWLAAWCWWWPCAAPARLQPAAVSSQAYAQLRLLVEALYEIDSKYVTEKKDRDLIYGAIRGMVASLDPNSSFLSPTEYQESQTGNKQSGSRCRHGTVRERQPVNRDRCRWKGDQRGGPASKPMTTS